MYNSETILDVCVHITVCVHIYICMYYCNMLLHVSYH